MVPLTPECLESFKLTLQSNHGFPPAPAFRRAGFFQASCPRFLCFNAQKQFKMRPGKKMLLGWSACDWRAWHLSQMVG